MALVKCPAFSFKCPDKMALMRSPVQPSFHFGPVRSFSLWCCAHFEMPLVTLGLSDRSYCGAMLIWIVKVILGRDLDKEVSYTELTQRSCTESSYRDLVERS